VPLPKILLPVDDLVGAIRKFLERRAKAVTIAVTETDLSIVYKMPEITSKVGGCTRFNTGDDIFQSLDGGAKRRKDYSLSRQANGTRY